jgi:hypothetical protein
VDERTWCRENDQKHETRCEQAHVFLSDHNLATKRPGPGTSVQPHTRVASGPQITKPPIRKIDNLYEKRTNPLGRLFTTLLSCKSRNLFARCWMRLTAITTLELQGDE